MAGPSPGQRFSLGLMDPSEGPAAQVECMPKLTVGRVWTRGKKGNTARQYFLRNLKPRAFLLQTWASQWKRTRRKVSL